LIKLNKENMGETVTQDTILKIIHYRVLFTDIVNANYCYSHKFYH